MELATLARFNVGTTIGQFRASPVSLGEGEPRAVCALYSEDAEIDPYIGMFFFPRHTLRLMVFDETGRVHWTRDLGPGVVPGVWFSPVTAFDLDGDGIDEIWIVNNTDPAHPLDYRRYVLERIDPRTGEATGQWPWHSPPAAQEMGYLYRHFIIGGHVHGEPVLVTAHGSYLPMTLRAHNADMSLRWQYEMTCKGGGPSASHVSMLVDIDDDGADELMWGERCIRLDSGREAFCCDRDSWTGHSDLVQPILNRDENRWYLHTIRESFADSPPRIATFDDAGNRIWSALDRGHIDTGWTAHIGENGRPVSLGVRIGEKLRSGEGERRHGVEEFTYDAFTGEEVDLGFSVYTTIPVDLDGDGLHELVRGYFEGNGDVLDRTGKTIGNTGGMCAMASQFTSKPGEQILSYAPDGTVAIWHDPAACDSPRALERYAHPFYAANQRLTGVGYNLFNLGGI